MSQADVESIVVGGGVVGLAIARTLALAGQEVLLLEQHDGLGTEVSSRNSEVIHAGIYYPPGSLRARLCVAGKAMLYDFARDHGVAHRRLGKLLVAGGEAQEGKLAAYAETARRNGVDDLVPLNGAEARALEPEVGCTAALLSPSTGILDTHAYMLALAGDAEAHGAQIVLRTRVESVSRAGDGGHYVVALAGDERAIVTCRRLVLSCGLNATTLAATFPFRSGYAPPPTTFARGRYYALRGRPPFSRLIYPMPDAAWLGIHLTLDLAGRARFGPDIVWIDTVDYGFDGSSEHEFYAAVRSYWPGLPDGMLMPDTTGIRPKLYRPGEPVPDFAIHGRERHGEQGLVILLGIESPGLTASLAIGEHVRELLTTA